MKKCLILTMVTLLGWACSGWAQTFDSLRIMTYNVLNYPGNTSAVRNPYFRTVLGAISPDILIVQEMQSSAGLSQFLTQVMNYGQPGTYDTARFHIGGPTDDTRNALFFKTSKVQHILPDTFLTTALRDIAGYRLRPVGMTADSLDIQIYSAHLKANDGEEAARAAETLILRNHLNSLPDGGNFMAGGDWNLYTSSEQAWTNLTGSQTDNTGRLFDPINTPGSWHSNATFAGVHTQSTRNRQMSDGGATGGMDDRFDFLLFSQNFQAVPGWEYIPGSYNAFGNDGNNCCNDSINERPNTAVGDIIADALCYASDHLPVILTVRRTIYSGTSLTIMKPNGGEIWTGGTQDTIKWSSLNLTGTVTIQINRSYPSSSWETLFPNTANDGSQVWSISGPASTTARVRILSDSQPSIGDTSGANFTIRVPSLSLTAPNGSDIWYLGTANDITWGSQYLTGTVTVQLNRNYPSGNWDNLYTGTANDGIQTWTVGGTTTSTARIRILSDAVPTAGDTSDADFSISHSAPPVIVHDLHGDVLPGNIVFTAKITDDLVGVSAKLFWKTVAAVTRDSVLMTPTAHPPEFSATLSLTSGNWQYYLRATDSDPQSVATSTYNLTAAPACGRSIAYDDGTAELFNWSEQDSFAWAVRFSPTQTPFYLCEASIQVAGFHPDTAHTPIRVQVLAADGLSGLPGTLLRQVVKGSIGNVIGGLPGPGAYPARFVLYDSQTDPLVLNGDFYVAVSNPPATWEGFGMDTSSALTGRSFLYDPCDHQWYAEDGVHSGSHRGNRMIRATGWYGSPSQLTIATVGDDVRLKWVRTGSVYYHVYQSTTPDFLGQQFVGTTSDSVYVISGAVPEAGIMFYRVSSSSIP